MEGEGSSFKATISSVDIHILVVDDDPIALTVLSAMLRTWKYQVVTAKNPFEALDTLRMKKGLFDLVISDLHMPQMNGLELQNKVRQEFDLPVVMISADEKESVILESLEKGAAFYIVKPVKVDDLKHVWQYAVASKKGKSKVSSLTSSIAIGNYVENDYYCVNILSSSFGNDESKRFKLKRKASSKWCKEKYCHPPKRAKVVWTNSLHNRFLHAIRQIGLHKAVPKRILEFMNVPGLTRENVASHLQKYRLFLKRVTDDGFFPIQGFSDIASGTSFAPFLPSMGSKNVQPSHKEFPKHQLCKQPLEEKSNPPNPNYSLFSTQKASVGNSITHLGDGQVLKSTKFHPSDVPTHYQDDGLGINNPHMHQNLSVTQFDFSTSYTQRPDMFINYPSTHFESIANNPNFSSSATPFSSNVFAGMRTNNGENKLMITDGQIGFNGTIVDESYQFFSRFPSTNQYDDTGFVQASPLQSYYPRNEDVLPFNCIDRKKHLISDDVCRLFKEENNNQSSFEEKDEEERLLDLYNVFNQEPNLSMKEALHSDICSSYSTKEGGSTRQPQPLGQLDENNDVKIVKNMDPSDQYKSCSVPIPHQPSKQIEEEIPNFQIHGLRKEENAAVPSPNEGWDEDILEILFGDNESERDLEIHLSEIFSKS